MAGDKQLNSTAVTVLRVLTVICAILIVIMGVIGVWQAGEALGNSNNTTNTVLNLLLFLFVGLYLIVFGCLLILAEMRQWSAVKYFGFLFSYFGRGCFMVFCGILILPYGCPFPDCNFNEFGLVVGGIVMAIGFVSMCLGCCFTTEQNPKPSYA